MQIGGAVVQLACCFFRVMPAILLLSFGPKAKDSVLFTAA